MPLYPTQPSQTALQTPGAPEGRKQKGTGFTNIRNLLQANVGAGQTMGSAIGAGLGQKAGQLSKDVSAAGQKFQEQYQQEKEKALGEKGSIGTVGGILGGNQDVSSLSSEEAQKIGETLRGAQYGGATELENQKALMSRAGNIQALSTLAGMGGIGQGRLLQGIGSRRGAYTRGQGLLDQYLLGQDETGQDAIRQAATQATGAAQQVQTGASVAAEQAEGLTKSIEAQKQEVQQNILKSLAGTEEQAQQGAKRFLDQANRIKSLITGDIPLDQQNEEDIALRSNLAQYGLNEFTINEMDPDVVEQIINSIASSASTEYTGQKRYETEAEQKAARNLALLSGQKDIAEQIERNKFDPNVFADANQSIEAQLGTTTQRTEDLQRQTGITTPEQAVSTIKQYNESLNMKDANRYGNTLNFNRSTGPSDLIGAIDGNLEGLQDEGQLRALQQKGWYGFVDPNSFIGRAIKFLGKDQVKSVISRVEDEDGGLFGATDEYMNDRIANILEDQMKAKLQPIQALNKRYTSTMSLQDYINKNLSKHLKDKQEGGLVGDANAAVAQLGQDTIRTYGTKGRRPLTIEEYRRVFNVPSEIGSKEFNDNLDAVMGWVPGQLKGPFPVEFLKRLKEKLSPYL
jgi:hypothetical protein